MSSGGCRHANHLPQLDPLHFNLDLPRLAKLLLFGTFAWLAPASGVGLLALEMSPPLLAIGLSAAGWLAMFGLVAWRCIRRRQPILSVPQCQRRNGSLIRKQWSEIANPKGNLASRWVMYEDLTGWLSDHDWTNKVVGEIGGSNNALRSFVTDARYNQLPFPEYNVQDLHQIDDNQFDLMILDQVLEHVPDPERALKEVRRVLKPGGLAIITTPFLTPVHPGPDFGDYYRWSPQGMETVLRRNGFDPTVRMWGNLKAAKALTENMYMDAQTALDLGLDFSEYDASFPVSVWARALNLKG